MTATKPNKAKFSPKRSAADRVAAYLAAHLACCAMYDDGSRKSPWVAAKRTADALYARLSLEDRAYIAIIAFGLTRRFEPALHKSNANRERARAKSPRRAGAPKLRVVG